MRLKRIVFSGVGIVAAFVLLYFAAYLSVVEREPVFSGNNLRLLALAYPGMSQGSIVPLVPSPAPARVPDWYKVRYRAKAPWVAPFFQPANWVDRHVRSTYWPPGKRGGC